MCYYGRGLKNTGIVGRATNMSFFAMIKEFWEEFLEPENMICFIQGLFSKKKPWLSQ